MYAYFTPRPVQQPQPAVRASVGARHGVVAALGGAALGVECLSAIAANGSWQAGDAGHSLPAVLCMHQADLGNLNPEFHLTPSPLPGWRRAV